MVVAVLRADNQRFGLVVDRVLNTEEIVVKPLASQLRAAATYAGATLMGNGRVALILDVQAIARRALVGDLVEQVGSVAVTATTAAGSRDLLVVALDDTRRAAIPLDAPNNFDWADCMNGIERLTADRQRLVIDCIAVSSCDALKPDPQNGQIACLLLGDQ